MATIPAIALAVQYAAGVPVSGSQQLCRNLVNKTHKTSIMAAKSNAAVQYADGVLASAPCYQFQVHTKIFKDEVVGWNAIRESLAKSDDKSRCNEFGYLSDVVIDQTSTTPIMTVTLSKANPETESPAEAKTDEEPAPQA